MLQICASVIVGLFIGVFSGLLGIGGGMMMVPAFRLGFGLSAIASTATSLFVIIPTSISGCITHIRNKTCVVPVGVMAGIGGAISSPLGVYLASVSPAWAIMVVAACVIAYSGATMLKKALKAPKHTGAPIAQAKTTSASEEASEDGGYLKSKLWLGLPIGAIAGLASGYVGVGGGFIMVPLFLSLLDVQMRQASGTSLLAIMFISIAGVASQFALGNINIGIGIAVAIGAIPGAVIGANLVRRIPERQLRFAFAAFLFMAAILLVVNEVAL